MFSAKWFILSHFKPADFGHVEKASSYKQYVFEWNKESREITEELNFGGVIKLELHNHLNTKVSLLHSRMLENQLLPSSFSGVSQPLFPKSSLSSLEWKSSLLNHDINCLPT